MEQFQLSENERAIVHMALSELSLQIFPNASDEELTVLANLRRRMETSVPFNVALQALSDELSEEFK